MPRVVVLSVPKMSFVIFLYQFWFDFVKWIQWLILLANCWTGVVSKAKNAGGE
jgi:hypothetical protein